MSWLKLTKTSELGEVVGQVLVNGDNIESVEVLDGVTSVNLVSGKTRWVKETPEEVWGKVQS